MLPGKSRFLSKGAFSDEKVCTVLVKLVFKFSMFFFFFNSC